MAEITITKGLAGAEDISQHDPTVGSPEVEQTFTRTRASGSGTVTRTKLNATHVPILDAPDLTDQNTAFSALSGANHTTEEALKLTRQNVMDLINFEHRGGIQGDGITTAQQTINADLLDEIINEIRTGGRAKGIFFDGGTWEIGRKTGHNVSDPAVDETTVDEILFKGIGEGSKIVAGADLVATSSASTFFRLQNTNRIVFEDIKIVATGLTGDVVLFEATSAAANRNKAIRTTFTGGARGLVFMGASGSAFRQQNATVKDCYLDGQTGKGIFLDNIGGARLWDCEFNAGSATGGGIGGLAEAANEALSDIEIIRCKNIASTNDMDINLDVTTAWSSALHARNTVNDCKCNTIDIARSSQLEIRRNTLSGGRIVLVFDQAGTATEIFINDNIIDSTGSLQGGIDIAGTGNIQILEISGGKIKNANTHGIGLASNGSSVFDLINIHDVVILDPARAGAGAFSGLLFNGNDIRRMYVHANTIYNPTDSNMLYAMDNVASSQPECYRWGNLAQNGSAGLSRGTWLTGAETNALA